MLAVLLSSATGGDVDATFTYRWSRLYEHGAQGRLPVAVIDHGAITLPDVGCLVDRVGGRLNGLGLTLAKVFIYGLPLRQLFQAWDVAVMWRVLRRERPDVLHINNGGFPGGASCNAAVVAARLAGVPSIVYVVNNIAAGYRRPDRWFDYPLDRLVARWVTRFVTGSLPAAERLRRVLRLSAERVKAIHNGIIERKPDETPIQTRHRLGIPADAVLVTMIALLEQRKGHRVLIDALTLMPPSAARRTVLVIEGRGPELSAITNQVKRLGLDSQVILVPHERNVWNLLAASDVVVLPSIANEDFPNVVIEAMAVGKPVIASRLAGIPEQVVDDVTGVLIVPGDTPQLAAALTRLVTSDDERKKMGRAGRDRFLREFAAHSACTRYWKLYRELVLS